MQEQIIRFPSLRSGQVFSMATFSEISSHYILFTMMVEWRSSHIETIEKTEELTSRSTRVNSMIRLLIVHPHS
jgi:hypothetical protein